MSAGHVAPKSMYYMVFLALLIGTGLSRATLRAVGARPLMQGVLLWIAVACASLAVILLWHPQGG